MHWVEIQSMAKYVVLKPKLHSYLIDDRCDYKNKKDTENV